jgi:RimJ/RimL family protein N-acetyltransferase
MKDVDTFPWVGTFDDLNPVDRLSVAQLVVDGGAIVGARDQIAARLKNARMLVVLREEGTGRIVGVASLKNPDPGYRQNKFADAGVAIAGYEDAPELGYVVVAKEMRGKKLSGRLVDLIAKKLCEPAFATTDNETMMHNLSRSGFNRVGREWQGKKAALSLWIFTPPRAGATFA